MNMHLVASHSTEPRPSSIDEECWATKPFAYFLTPLPPLRGIRVHAMQPTSMLVALGQPSPLSITDQSKFTGSS